MTIQGYDSAISGSAPSVEASFIHLSDEVPINSITNAYIVEDQLIVVSAKGVFRYDMTGDYLGEISHKGRSGDEWITVGPVIIDQETQTLILYDTSSKKVMRFSFTGEFKGSSPVSERLFTIYQAESLPGGKTVYTHGIINDSGVLYSIEDSTGNVISSFPTRLSTKGACEKIGKHPLSVYEGDIKAVMPFDNKVYNLIDNKLIPCYSIDTGKKLISRKGLRGIDDYSFNEYILHSERGYFVGPNNIFETSSHILLSYFDISYILIDKQSGESRCFQPRLGAKLEHLPPIGVVNTSCDYFVGVVDVMTANSFGDFLPDNCQDEALLSFKEVASAPINSNPFIALYRF